MIKIKKRFSLVLILVLVLSLAAAGVALAQANSSSQPGASLKQLYLEKLAANLGIDVSRLQEAMKNAGQQAVEAAQASGLIDSTRAQKLQKALEDGYWPGFGGFKRPAHGWGYKFGSEIADALGITPQELHQELKDGKTLEQIAATKGLTLDQLKEQLISAAKTKLDQAVAGGKLSKEKADMILNRLEQLDLSKFPGQQQPR
ncbi:hypothetical protein [Moorella sp. ACPs]|uniref:hypothetical protein n=1 Tax=Neomoorella carbonis TaxID=3062783 RepID=UPI00324C1A7B